MSEPTVSVIIHFLNAERHLRDSVRSVLWQTLEGWELLLVDGGSSDKSVEIAREMIGRCPGKVRVYRHEGPGTLGIFSSRVWGAREARARSLRTWIQTTNGTRDSWSGSTVFIGPPSPLHGAWCIARWCTGGRITRWRPKASYVQPIPPPGRHEPPGLLPDIIRDGYARSPGNSAVMIGRDMVIEAAELIGVADETMVEDQFLWSLVMMRYPVYVNPEPLTRYRQWSGSVCAQAIGAGLDGDLRRRHLAWLTRHIVSSCSGPERVRLLEAVYSELGTRVREP